MHKTSTMYYNTTYMQVTSILLYNFILFRLADPSSSECETSPSVKDVICRANSITTQDRERGMVQGRRCGMARGRA